jgi:hypothetical protein
MASALRGSYALVRPRISPTYHRLRSLGVSRSWLGWPRSACVQACAGRVTSCRREGEDGRPQFAPLKS